jgi:hypothetical protein
MTATYEPNTPLSPTEYDTVERFGLARPVAPVPGQNGHGGTEGPKAVETATAAEWATRKGIIVANASGWNTSTPNAFDADWNRQITEAEFDKRAKASECIPAGNLQRQDNVKGRAY